MGSKLQWVSMPGGGISTYDGGKFCGPGWGYTREDVASGKVATIPEAVDAIDRACAAHDQCYADNGYLTMKCNVKLASRLLMIVADPTETPQRKADAYIMAAIFQVEAMTVDVAVFLPKETYSKLDTFISGAWARTSRSMESIINEAYLRVCSEAAGAQGFSAAQVCR